MRRGFVLVLLVLLATSCTDGRSDRDTAPDVPPTTQLADAADDRVGRILSPCLPTGSVVAGSLPGTCHDEGSNGIGQFQPP